MGKEPLLRPEEVASVLSGDDERRPEETPASEGPTVYSLRRPVAIAPSDEPAARKRLAGLVAGLNEALCGELEAELSVEVTGFRQEQAGAAVETLPRPAWILGFLHADGGGIGLALEPTCALSLVEIALGGAGNSSATGREPTGLEYRVLNKLCAALAPPLGRHTGMRLTSGIFEAGTLPRTVADGGETVGIGLLRLRVADADRNGLLLVTPRLLAPPVAERHRGEGAAAIGPLAPRLDRAPVRVRPVLDAGLVALGDLVALRPGKLLRLETGGDHPLGLRVNGRHVFLGRIARDGDRPVFQATWRRGRRRAPRGEDDDRRTAEENKKRRERGGKSR